MSNSVCALFDTHVHLDATEFDQTRESVLVSAHASGVQFCLNPSVTVAGFKQVEWLAMESKERVDWPWIYPAYGIHPLYVNQSHPNDLLKLEAQVQTGNPVAIGEIGLDLYEGAPEFSLQKKWFEDQLLLAIKHQLPVVLHVRHAVEEVIQSIKRVQGRTQKIPGGIAHAFNGSDVQAQQLMRMGFLLGFGGSATYDGSKRIRSLVTRLPLTSIVLETDAPDMRPQWIREGCNAPNQLPLIGKTIANLREIPLVDLAQATTENACQLLAVPSYGACAR
jgi:TatD DNase family protein